MNQREDHSIASRERLMEMERKRMSGGGYRPGQIRTVPVWATRLLLLCLASFLAFPVWSAPALFRFQAGKSYVFEVKTNINSEIQAYEFRDSKSEDRVATFSLRPISFARGVWVLDLEQEGRHRRRYMRENGQVIMSPGQMPWETPFFLTLPAGEPAPNKVFRYDSALPAERGTVPARWELACKGVDSAQNRITYILAGSIPLPSDQMVKRSLAVKGGFVFDQSRGVCDSGEWTLTYAFETANKEFAVIRPLWSYRETRKISFRLLEVTE